MGEGWQRKPGDRVVRIHYRPYRLRRVLGIPALYSAGYGNVGSSIYYALGVVTLAAMGATPIMLAIAGIFFVFATLTYAEGSALFTEAGGSASFARHGFNELAGFLAGWALMLSYIVTISISAFVIPPYLGYFWEPLKTSPVISTATAIGIIVALMILNIIGIRETSALNIVAATIDLLTQVTIVALGFIFLFNLPVLLDRITTYWPEPKQLILGLALASIAYTGVETISQMAEETRRPAFRVPRALMLMAITVLVIFSGISLVAFSTMSPTELATHWSRDPVAGIAHNLPLKLAEYQVGSPVGSILFAWFAEVMEKTLPLLVALLAATILLLATNAGLIGISRLAFSLGRSRQLPMLFSRLHQTSKTPYISLIVFTLVAILILLPGFFSPQFILSLGALYVFGSKLTFSFAHASIISLRVQRPDLPRPWKATPNLRIKGKEIPITAVLGLMFTLFVWLFITITQPFSRWAGLGWMSAGLLLYIVYRRSCRLPLTSTPESIILRQEFLPENGRGV